jgi:putative SOS response-associated peptidase YedK
LKRSHGIRLFCPRRFIAACQARTAWVFAGLRERCGPDNLLTCTILTTDASDGIRDIHTRMPVMLAKETFEPWLSGSDPVTDPDIDAAVDIWPVPPKMNKPSYYEPDCVNALATA